MASKEEEAQHWLEEGNRCHQGGNIEQAIAYYKKSIQLCPSAEAHTFLGWMYSFQGRIEEAIQQCKMAIQIDSEFGNPYNDIGVYLIGQGRLEEAEQWLRKAMRAQRYEPRHFPHLNMGRIHLARKEHGKALDQFRRALEHAPEDQVARAAFLDLVGKLN